ncbi:MAG: hypothetical protein ACLS9T_08000 [Streptococcus salivarius]
MKIKTSHLIYAVIGTIFAGLSMFTEDIFEKGNFEAIFKSWRGYYCSSSASHSHHYGLKVLSTSDHAMI